MKNGIAILTRKIILGALCLVQLAGVTNAFAGGEAVIIAATGGEAIPADTAASGTWTTLTGPVIIETYARDIGYLSPGDITLTAPQGFEFNTGAEVLVQISGSGHKIINGLDDGDTIRAVATPSTLTVTITETSRGGYAYPDTLTWKNIQVRPKSTSPLALGDLTQTGNCQFRDLTLPTGTWGALRQVGSTLAGYVITSAGPVTAGSPTTITIQKVDQYGNPLAEGGSSILIFDGLGSQGGNEPTINGTLLGTGVQVTFDSNGTATVTLVAYKAETATLTVSDGTNGNLGPGLEVTVAPGTAVSLVFDTESPESVYGSEFSLTARTVDLYGNLSNVGLPENLPISLAIPSGEASLVGDTIMNIGTSGGNGVITFKDLEVTAAGEHELIASSDGTIAGSVRVNVGALVVSPIIFLANKNYDGTTTATLANAFVTGALPGDEVTLIAEGNANFWDKNVGVSKAVSVTGLRLGGMAARNYVLSQTSVVGFANIAPRPLVITATGTDKVYDGNKSATVTLADDRIPGDRLELGNSTAGFEDGEAGFQKRIVVVGITARGDDSPNYTTPETATATATISKAKAIATAESKSRAVGQPNPNLTGTVEGVLPGDAVSFTFTTDATTLSSVGTYAIIPIAVDPADRLANYELNISMGILTIVPTSLVASLNASQSPSVHGAAVSFTARFGTQFSGASQNSDFPPEIKPTGEVVFRVNGAAVGSPVALVDGVALLNTSLLPAGTNVVAVDYAGDNNFSGTSTSIEQLVVTPLPEPKIISVKDNGDKTLTITFLGTPGQPYVVQATSDLTIPVTWENVSTNTAGTWDGNWIYSEDMTNYQQRFFRAVNP
jgi:hypothetical protein